MIATLDCETTIFQKGNPFARRNKLCYLATLFEGRPVCAGTPAIFPSIRSQLDAAALIVGFNIKFDLHWLRREFGWVVGKDQRVWDCQLAHFLLTSQRTPYPSLEEVREYNGVVRTTPKGSSDYWARGIDTPDIDPETVLTDVKNDVLDTYAVYLKQVEAFAKQPQMRPLFRLHCEDLVVLESMESTGLLFNENQAKASAVQLRLSIDNIDRQIKDLCPGVPINLDSPEHISALLYGGIIREDRKEVVGLFKSGLRAGQPRYQHKEIEHVLPRLAEPLDGTALKKDGYFSTDESVLRQLSGAKQIRDQLLSRSRLSKELDYMQGLPELRDEMDWEPNNLHTSFNQCVAATGRLSSSKPNVQNPSDSTLKLIESRYDR